MWPRLRKHVAVEREQLRRLLADHSPLLAKCATGTPHWIEVSALAVMLHSFYSGVENIYPFQLEWNECRAWFWTAHRCCVCWGESWMRS